MALVFSDVTKIYPKSTKKAVTNISFSVSPGSIVAMLGPNGAGKTTTLRMAAGILQPSEGKVSLNDVDSVKDSRRYRRQVGLHLGGDSGFYAAASVKDNLEYFALLSGVPRKQRKQSCREALELVDLCDQVDKKVCELSHGMRQRLHLARAIVGEPQLLLLDEPTSGLDPTHARAIRRLIASMREPKCVLILSTHQMSEAQQLADYVFIINEGQIQAQGSPAELLSKWGVSDLEGAYLSVIDKNRQGDNSQE